jgi:hypothetical protein
MKAKVFVLVVAGMIGAWLVTECVKRGSNEVSVSEVARTVVESRGGEGAAAKGATSREKTAKGATSREKTAKGATSREKTAKGTTLKDGAAKERVVNERVMSEKAVSETSVSEKTLNEKTAKEKTAKGATSREKTAKEKTVKGATSREKTAKEKTMSEKTVKEKASQCLAVEEWKAGAEVSEALIKECGGEEAFFRNLPVDSVVFRRIEGESYAKGCIVPVEELRYLRVLHRDLEGRIRLGELICNKGISIDLLEIFKELYEAGYPIQSIRLVDEFGADDERSMEANNTSCFNYRTVPGKDGAKVQAGGASWRGGAEVQTGGASGKMRSGAERKAGRGKMSKHAYGLAVDINPLYNPYVRGIGTDSESVLPNGAGKYLDRGGKYPYKIVPGDLCHRLFVRHGFVWGGGWRSSKDYQHFEKR